MNYIRLRTNVKSVQITETVQSLSEKAQKFQMWVISDPV